jgi:hypothetical protein
MVDGSWWLKPQAGLMPVPQLVLQFLEIARWHPTDVFAMKGSLSRRQHRIKVKKN